MYCYLVMPGWGSECGAGDGQILSVPLTPTTPRNVTVIE